MKSEASCPHCGAAVPLNARGCRQCGAARGEGGWNRPEIYDGLDLPGEDDDFDYEEFVAREFGTAGKPGPLGWPAKKLFWWVVAVITLLAFAALALSGLW